MDRRTTFGDDWPAVRSTSSEDKDSPRCTFPLPLPQMNELQDDVGKLEASLSGCHPREQLRDSPANSLPRHTGTHNCAEDLSPEIKGETTKIR